MVWDKRHGPLLRKHQWRNSTCGHLGMPLSGWRQWISISTSQCLPSLSSMISLDLSVMHSSVRRVCIQKTQYMHPNINRIKPLSVLKAIWGTAQTLVWYRISFVLDSAHILIFDNNWKSRRHTDVCGLPSILFGGNRTIFPEIQQVEHLSMKDQCRDQTQNRSPHLMPCVKLIFLFFISSEQLSGDIAN